MGDDGVSWPEVVMMSSALSKAHRIKELHSNNSKHFVALPHLLG